MASFVVFSNQRTNDPKSVILEVFNYDTIPNIVVKAYKDGIYIIDPPNGANILEFLEFVSGIFDPESNIPLYLAEYFHVPKESFRAVKFDFNDVEFTETKFVRDPQKLYKRYQEEQKKIRKGKR